MPQCIHCVKGKKPNGEDCEYCDGTGYWEKDNPY